MHYRRRGDTVHIGDALFWCGQFWHLCTCLIMADHNRYSVDARAAGRMVLVRSHAERIVVLFNDEIVADHPRQFRRDQIIYDPWRYATSSRTAGVSGVLFCVGLGQLVEDQPHLIVIEPDGLNRGAVWSGFANTSALRISACRCGATGP